MAAIAETNSLFEIDAELDLLLEEMEEQAQFAGHPSEELVAASSSSAQRTATRWSGSAASSV